MSTNSVATLIFSFFVSLAANAAPPFYCEKSSYVENNELFAIGIAVESNEAKARETAFENGKKEIANYLQRPTSATSIATVRTFSEKSKDGIYVCRLLKVDLKLMSANDFGFTSHDVVGDSNASTFHSLAIFSEPSKATLLIDGEVSGVTNASFSRVSAGKHEISILKDGYASISETIDLTKASTLTFSLQPKVVELTVESNAQVGEVSVDGKYVARLSNGKAIIKLQVLKSYLIKVASENYREAIQNISLSANDVSLVRRFELDGFPGKLTVVSEPMGAQIFLDGKEFGKTPATLSVSPKSYELRLSHPDFASHKEAISVLPGKSLKLPMIKLKKPTGVQFDETDEGIKRLEI